MGRPQELPFYDGGQLKPDILRSAIRPIALLTPLTLALTGTSPAMAQTTAPTTAPSTQPTTIPTTRPRADISGVSAQLKGRRIESVRVQGNSQMAASVILNQVRTREGEPFDPITVEEDYKRIYALKRFANVEAKVEPTDTGLLVTFVVVEQRTVRQVGYKGNTHIDTLDLQNAVDLKAGEAVDPFRISLGRQAIERLYHDKNYPYVHVSVDEAHLAQTGELTFNIVEGAKVRIRRVTFEGNQSFSNIRLRGQVKSDYYIWILRAGEYDFETVEDDVASLRKFYESKGFFDVKVGRKLAFSANQSEMQITFVIDEGKRYTISKITFTGNQHLTAQRLLANLKLVQGGNYDQEIVQRDIRQIVKEYSPFGYVYQAPPATPNPDYLDIKPKTIFQKEPGKLELIYEIREGKPFHMGRLMVKGNSKTQDKVILREMRVGPGQLYNSAELADAVDRLRGTGYFTNVSVAPVGQEPNLRDVLVEVTEGKTASFNIGAGISSSGGVGAEISYEQRNFDIGNWPTTWSDIFSDRAWVGAGQTFRASVSPSTTGTTAAIRFYDPWIFDQPYSFANDLYLRQRIYTNWEETRIGDRVTFGKRLDNNWTLFLSGRGEDVNIHNVKDEALRAPEVIKAQGHTTVTGAGPAVRYDTTNRGPLQSKGVLGELSYERVGALGGQVNFNKFSFNFDQFYTVYEDLFDRKTILSLKLGSGYIDSSSAPIFERYYLGGFGSVRGFQFRGISPRSGPDNDPIGGTFFMTTSAELSYPIYTDMLRGVLFVDGGTNELQAGLDNYRLAVGFGFRVVFPFAQQAPLAIDFGFPIVKNDQDETQLISFSFGVVY